MKEDVTSMQTPSGSVSLLSTSQPFSKKLLDNSSVANKMQGEFSIVKGYGGSLANLFGVANPHAKQGQEHIVYTVTVRPKQLRYV